MINLFLKVSNTIELYIYYRLLYLIYNYIILNIL